ncbi:MAG: S24 family peptidase [Acidobacteriota bacterium]|nr:S24 family peptidase [Acidobacteriota bacterium]
MPAAVISIDRKKACQSARREGSDGRHGFWWVLEVAPSGRRPLPYGILLVDKETGELTRRLREPDCFRDLEEQEFDILLALTADLDLKAGERGGLELLDWLEDGASNFLRIGERSPISYANPTTAVDGLFEAHVDSTVRPFVTHLPVFGLRAAATKFGEGMEVEQESWVRAPENLRLAEGMFVAYVVGRSMEPLIPDGSACIFRAPVTGSRRNRYLLIEKFGETDFASRYTVKKYARQGNLHESADREEPVRLEPLNPEFEPFELTGDGFRVVAEFVQVLES